MRWAFAGLIAVHGLIHLMGFAKAFGLAELPELAGPISRPWGTAWLIAAMAVLATSVTLLAAPRAWWIVGSVAVLLSQAVVFSSWGDARLGTAVNLLILAGVVYGFASRGPQSFHAAYRRSVSERLAEPVAERDLTESDLVGLPEPVRRYVRLAGAVGQPRVHHFRATWRGRIRAGPDEPWMAFTAEQTNFPGEPARFFLMDAKRSGLPVDVFHSFRDGSASMRVRLVSLVPLVDMDGAALTRAETVTLFNDLCLLAPSALVDAPIRWEEIDERSVRGQYTVGPNTVSAVLFFDEAGDLVNFVSDDRLKASADGTTLTAQRWSTPVGEYRRIGPWRVSTRGEGRWHTPEGEFVYVELELTGLEVNGVEP